MRRWVILLVGLGAAPALASEPGPVLEKIETLEAQAIDDTAPAQPLSPAEATTIDPAGDAPLEDALTCLARTIYWEAKGEAVAGMEAVANVVMNRLAAADFPDTVCAVVTQGQNGGPCQFSWWCDGKPIEVEEPDRYALTTEIARRALNQELPDRTDGALFFLQAGMRPDWAETMVETLTVGDHVFLRPPAATAG